MGMAAGCNVWWTECYIVLHCGGLSVKLCYTVLHCGGLLSVMLSYNVLHCGGLSVKLCYTVLHCGGLLSVMLHDQKADGGDQRALIACHESGVISNPAESNWNPPGVVLWLPEC